jgi:hypothetical protein
MDILVGVVGVVGVLVGIAIATGLRGRRKHVRPADPHEQDLKALLDEVRALRTDIDILKLNPTIGSAVNATLQHAHAQADFDRSAYDVAVRPGALPKSSYNVAVSPVPRVPGGDPAR